MVNNWATSFSHYKNRGLRWFFGAQLSVCVLFLFPVIFQFSKNSLFQKRGAKIGFSNFQCFKLIFWKFSFLGLLKHYKNRGFSKFGFFVVEREENRQKNDNWNLWILVFWSKNGRFVTHICFPKKGPETPIFIVFWGWALFGPRCQKGKFWKATQKKKKLTDNWKAIFLVFLLFFGGLPFFFFLFFFFLFFVVCFFWRV